MSDYQFNGSILNFAGITLGITSFSEDGGSRPEIDVTTSTDTRRKSLAGMPSVPTLSFGFHYDGVRTNLIGALEGCTAGNTTLQVTKDCTTEYLIGASDAPVLYYLMGWNIAGDLDGAIIGSVDLMRAETNPA